MGRNKYNANFFEENKKYNTNQNNTNPENLDNNHSNRASTKLENNNDYPNVEFARESGTCEEEFERSRRERNKQKNLK